MADPLVHPRYWLATSELVSVGRVEVPPEHEAWHRPNRTASRHCLAFPSRAIETDPDGEGPRVIDPTIAIFANPDWPYRRKLIDPRGESTFILEFPVASVREVVHLHDPAAADRPCVLFRWGEGLIAPRTALRARRFAVDALRGAIGDALELEERALDLLDVSLEDAARWRASAAAARTDATPRPATRRAHREIVHEACRVMAAAPARRHSLRSLGRQVHLAPHHFCRVFRREMGRTVHQHLTQLRLAAAIAELVDSERSGAMGGGLEELARRHGFADRSHFTRICRRELGVPPARLRRELRGAD